MRGIRSAIDLWRDPSPTPTPNILSESTPHPTAREKNRKAASAASARNQGILTERGKENPRIEPLAARNAKKPLVRRNQNNDGFFATENELLLVGRPPSPGSAGHRVHSSGKVKIHRKNNQKKSNLPFLFLEFSRLFLDAHSERRKGLVKRKREEEGEEHEETAE